MVDVVLVGEEGRLEIPAHKLLLAACSPYFNSRFGLRTDYWRLLIWVQVQFSLGGKRRLPG